MLFTYPYAALHNYQNDSMHKNKLRVNPILIDHVIKVYELEWEPLGPIE